MSATRVATYCRICSPLCGLLVDVEDGRVTHVAGDPDPRAHPRLHVHEGPSPRRAAPRARPVPHRAAQRARRPSADPHRSGDRRDRGTPAHDPRRARSRIDRVVRRHAELHRVAHVQLRGRVAPRRRLAQALLHDDDRPVGEVGRDRAPRKLGRPAASGSKTPTCGSSRERIRWCRCRAATSPASRCTTACAGSRRRDARGLQLIVVDPRRTEVAAHADLHLQLVPGTDVALFAALLRTILAEGLHDVDFCTRWVNGLDALRAAVEPMTPEVASGITGVDRDADRRGGARVRARARGGWPRPVPGPTWVRTRTSPSISCRR